MLQARLTVTLVHGAGLVQALELQLLKYGVQAAAEVYNAVVQQQVEFLQIPELIVKSQ
jgi:hypothetical protein